MIAIIVAIDQLIWRPLIAWSDKFKFEQVESSQARQLAAAASADRTPTRWRRLRGTRLEPLEREPSTSSWPSAQQRSCADGRRPSDASRTRSRSVLRCGAAGDRAGAARWSMRLSHAVALLRPVHGREYLEILKGAVATFLRVNFSLLLAAAWTIPAGVAIGFNPRLARIAQPLAQIAASVPATALFPVILLALIRLGGGMGIGSIALMLLGTQWYILFNVIAGAMAIPTDLKEVATLFRFSTVQRWKTVILPGIFPFLITGMVTASGGAWNASIIAEYFRLNGPDPADARPGRADQRGHRERAVPDHSAGDDSDLADGGDDQPAGLAAALSAGGDALQARLAPRYGGLRNAKIIASRGGASRLPRMESDAQQIGPRTSPTTAPCVVRCRM